MGSDFLAFLTIVELAAIVNGLQIVRDVGFRVVICESDSNWLATY
jgi:ribonuclease HI